MTARLNMSKPANCLPPALYWLPYQAVTLGSQPGQYVSCVATRRAVALPRPKVYFDYGRPGNLPRFRAQRPLRPLDVSDYRRRRTSPLAAQDKIGDVVGCLLSARQSS